MRIDASKSTAENLLRLVNSQAKIPYQDGDFTLGPPATITPGAGNGMNNTQALLSGAGEKKGDVVVRYNRQTVQSNRPSAGNLIYCGNADTHASVHAAIAQKHRLVLEELVFTDPFEVPPGTFEANYTVAAKANSRLYAAGSMVINARNTDPLPAQLNPRWLFAYAGVSGSTDLYDLRASGKSVSELLPSQGNYATHLNNEKENFAQMLNFIAGRPGLIKASDFTLGAPGYQGYFNNLSALYTTAYQYQITITPTQGSVLKSGGVLYYWLYSTWAFENIPADIKADTSINRGKRVFQYLGLPDEKVTWQAYNPSFPDRVYYSIGDSVLFNPNTGTTYFTLL